MVEGTGVQCHFSGLDFFFNVYNLMIKQPKMIEKNKPEGIVKRLCVHIYNSDKIVSIDN